MKPILITLALLSLPTLAQNAKDLKHNMPNPDFTKGEKIPAGATHDWTLGATGARGWMHSTRLETTTARQIYITKVEPNSPAANILEVGDIILGVAGKLFSYDPRTEFGKALTAAEATDGKLALTRWKNGTSEEITIPLTALGAYSSTAPYNCEKSKKILEAGCKALAERMKNDPNYTRQNPIPRALNALALLASGNPIYTDIIKREVDWAANFKAESMATWYYGYVICFLAEYKIATGDDSVLPGLRRLAMEAATGQSAVGSWGHKFAKPDGTLYGYGMMNAPGVPLTISLVLAQKAGVNDPEIELAIERSLKLIRFYEGKGSVPYGDHNPWMQNHDDNGKNGMAAVLFNLKQESGPAEYFSKMSVASHGAERDTGHTGNFWNMTWAMPGVSQSGPNATGAWMNEFGAWYLDLARRHDGLFIHQGPPEPAGDHTKKWDATGSFLLAYAMPLKKTHLTGKQESSIPQLSPEQAQAIILDGRGWSPNNKFGAYDKLGGDELLDRLSSWSPTVRDRAAMAIARRKDNPPPIPAIIDLLKSDKLHSQYGACQAIIHIGPAAAPSIPTLRETLKHEDLWLRILAAEALAKMGPPAIDTLPELLTMMTEGESEKDPRGMQQRYISYFVFGSMLKNAKLQEIDRNLLHKAITAGLKNQDGRARGSISTIYDKLSYDEIKPILPAIHEAIVKPSPSGEMFASQVRLSGLNLLAKHKIKEGLPLCISVMDLENWGKQDRIKRCLDAIETYGPAAKPLLPQLVQLETELQTHSEAKSLVESAGRTKSIIQKLQQTNETVELRTIF